MRTVGTFEAKAHLSALLERVERGEEITITRHGRAVARLVPVEAAPGARASRTPWRASRLSGAGAGSAMCRCVS